MGLLRRLLTSFWQLAISPVTFVVLALTWCLDLGAGSLLAYYRSDLFGTLDNYPFAAWLRIMGPRAWPLSLWVHLLVVLSWLMVASLLLCTVNWVLFRRKRLKGLGEVLVHLGFLLVFAGFVLGATYGERTLGVRLPVGGSSRVEAIDATLTLRGLAPIIGPGGAVQGAASDLLLASPRGAGNSPRVRLNHPLIHGSTVVYPRGVQQQVEGASLALPGLGRHDIRPDRPVRLPDGRQLELVGLLQAEERQGVAQGPGIFVALRDAAGNDAGTAYLSFLEGMPASAMLSGQRVELADLQGPILGVYDVHRDPGVWLVVVGAVLIALGSFWALGSYLWGGTRSLGS